MAVLVLAPVLKLFEDGVQLFVGVLLEVAVDCDVAPVANLLGQVRGVEDELGLEEGVLARLGQEAEVEREVEVREGLVQETAGGGACTGSGQELIASISNYLARKRRQENNQSSQDLRWRPRRWPNIASIQPGRRKPGAQFNFPCT